ncbi:hypothetical protein RCS94_06985 [Orbaceae bacterium ac157xtp]
MGNKFFKVTKLIVFFLIAFNSFASDFNSSCLYSIHYDSEKYDIEIIYCCEEGELDCDNVYYKGTNKIDKSFIYLKGKVVTVSQTHRFFGYQFDNNEYNYIIRNDFLMIYKNGEFLQEYELHEIE